jgi:hypothetical protein
MPKFHIVTMDDIDGDLTPDDLERIEAGLVRLRALLDSPLALIERARDLLEGTAEPLV